MSAEKLGMGRADGGVSVYSRKVRGLERYLFRRRVSDIVISICLCNESPGSGHDQRQGRGYLAGLAAVHEGCD